jgi:SAM-dependent methyltransferase
MSAEIESPRGDAGPSRKVGVARSTDPLPGMGSTGRFEELPPTELLAGLFHLLFGRDPVLTPEGAFVRELENGTLSPRQLVEWLVHSDEWSNRTRMTELGPSLHSSRGAFIRLLPRAQRILDLGGTALNEPVGAMVSMGYPYAFDELVIVDLPSEDRNALYHEDTTRDTVLSERGTITYRYHSMTDLSAYATHSFDLVYCGQSIEHVTRRQAGVVYDQVRRVLRPGGAFALDTPNAVVTRLQQAHFIDPDHKHEYTHHEMNEALAGHGFEIRQSIGLNYAGRCLEAGVFSSEEVATRRGMYEAIEACYLLAYICRTPVRPSAKALANRAAWRVKSQSRRLTHRIHR